jgi:hypothetical protein
MAGEGRPAADGGAAVFSGQTSPKPKSFNTKPILFLHLKTNPNPKLTKSLPIVRIETHSGGVIFVPISFFLSITLLFLLFWFRVNGLIFGV